MLFQNIIRRCRRAIRFGRNIIEAQKQANVTGKKVYLSLKDPDDDDFAVMNMIGSDPFYYTLSMHQNESTKRNDMNYCVVVPDKYDDTAQTDDVQKYYGIMFEWVKMIIRNEEEKLTATDLVRNFDVDGGSGMTYSENFESSYSNSSSHTWPLGINTDLYFSASANPKDITLDVLNVLGKVALPTPEPANIPIRWPLPMVIIPSTALTSPAGV